MLIILRAAVAYIFLLLTVRLVSRRLASMMAPFDLVVLFLIGGASLSAVLGEDRSLVGAFTAIGTIGTIHTVVSWAKSKSNAFGRMIDGTPVVILENGKLHEDRMKMLGVQRSDIMAAIRQRGLQRLEQVRYVVVERDGKISIIEADAPDD